MINSLSFDLLKGSLVDVMSNQKYGEIIDQSFYSLFCGAVTFEECHFFIFAKELMLLGFIKNHKIYSIKDITVVPFMEY